MKRHRNRRQSPASKLNLVALMDIFTILVFFLMVNSSDVQIKDVDKSVKLPESTTTQLPEDTLKLFVSKDALFFDDSKLKIALGSYSPETGTYPELVERLKQIAAEKGELPEELKSKGRAITILGDKSTDYTTLKQILASCAETDYRNVSLAVQYEEKQINMTPSESAANGTNNTTATAGLSDSGVSE